METLKRMISLLLTMATLFGFAACTPPDKNRETTLAAEPAPEEEPSLYTDEEKALFLECASRNIERADAMAKAAVDVFVNKAQYKKNGMVDLAIECTISGSKIIGGGTSTVWEYTSFMAMTSRLQSITEDDYYDELYKNAYSTLAFYKGTGSVTTYNGTSKQSMYAVNRAGKKNTANIAGIAAVYDDQMWIIRELIYAYRLTGKSKYLNEAVSLTEVCLDGWDTTKDKDGNEIGGICWGPGYQTKHTCSNAPIIVALVDLYEIFTELGDVDKAESYLEWAKRVFNFCQKYFIKSDATYGDLVGSSRKEEGSGANRHYVTTSQSTNLDQATYTYNTGAMISGAAALYRATGEQKYFNAARKSVRAAKRAFGDTKVLDGYTLWGLSNRKWFNLILLEGFIEFYEFDPEECLEIINSFQDMLDYSYDNYLKKGFLPHNLLTGWSNKNEDRTKNIMEQTSVATMFAELSEFYAGIAEK